MKRSYALALSAVALFLATSASSNAQAVRPGQQCQPAVADPTMYGNCHLRIVSGQEVCRCAIRPQALRRMGPQDRGNLTTGSIASPRASGVGGFFESGTRSTVRAGASLPNAGSAPAMGSAPTVGSAPAAGPATADVASGAPGGMNGNGQGPGNNNGLGNGSEPADNTSTDVKGTDPSNPGGGNGGGRGGNGDGGDRGGNGNGGGNGAGNGRP